MTEINGKNGWNRLAPWIVGILAPPLIGGMVGWVSSHNMQIHNHAERIAVIESQLRDTRDELRSINQKIDRLLENQKRP